MGVCAVRLNIYLSDKDVVALDLWRAGRSRSQAVRDAVRLAIWLQPLVERLDRIEARLDESEPRKAGATPPEEGQAHLAAVIAASRTAGFIVDDDD